MIVNLGNHLNKYMNKNICKLKSVRLSLIRHFTWCLGLMMAVQSLSSQTVTGEKAGIPPAPSVYQAEPWGMRLHAIVSVPRG
jgi:hypothetical protein